MGHFSSQVPGKRLLRKEVTRRELLRAGRKLFSERGLYESRIEDLTHTAGIAKGTLYLYFRNKQELVIEVTAAGYRDLQDRIRRTLEVGPKDSLVPAIARAHLEFFAENPDLLRIFHQVRGILKFHHPEWEDLKAPLEGHIRFLARALGRAPTLARARASHRRDLALQIYGAISGMTSVQSALEPSTDLLRLLPLVTGSLGFASAGPARSARRQRPRGSPRSLRSRR